MQKTLPHDFSQHNADKVNKLLNNMLA